MSDTVRLHVSKPVEAPARRIEVFTGAGRRRHWSAEEKAAIVTGELQLWRYGVRGCSASRADALAAVCLAKAGARCCCEG